MNVDVEGQYPLLDKDIMPTPVLWKQKIENTLYAEGYKSGAWMYKDSRIALMWKIWNTTFPDAKWIIVRRRTGDIVQSCIKTGYMRAFKNPVHLKVLKLTNEADGWLWMAHEYEKRFADMISSKINHKIIWPERMVDGDFRQMHELCEWLELEWNDKALESIKKLLWNSKERV
jgi:hypothetical protein